MSSKTFVANKKGLFDIAQSEGLIDDDFALELQNARISINGEVRKRRGRMKLNTTAYAGTPDINTVTVFDGDFVPSYEIIATAGEDIRKYNSSTNAFDLIETGYTSGKRFSTTHFRGNLILTNGEELPFKYGYVGKPAQPTTGTSGSGSLSARTYFVKTTYVSSQIDQSHITNSGSDNIGDTSSNLFRSQVFQAGATSCINRVKLRLKRVGNPTDNIQVSVRATDGSGVPTGSDLTNQVSVAISTIKTEYQFIEFAFSTYTSLTSGTKYAIIITRSGSADSSNYIQIAKDTAGGYSDGGVYSSSAGSSWTETTSTDFNFNTYLLAGESKPSNQKEQAVSASNVLTVTAPIATDGAVAYNVYVSETSNAEVKQTEKPVALGSNFTEPDSGLVSLGALPTIYTSWYTKELDAVTDYGKIVFSMNGRIWFAGFEDEPLKILGSALDKDNDYTTANDSVVLDLGSHVTRGDEIVALNRFGLTNNLIIALKNHFIRWNVPAEFNSIVVSDVLFNVGAMSQRCVTSVPFGRSDIFMLGQEGLSSINVEDITGGLGAKKLTKNIEDRLKPILVGVTDQSEVNAINFKFDREYIVSVPSVSKRFIFDYELKAWSEDRNIKVNDMTVTPDGFLLSAGDDGFVYREYQTSARVNVYGDSNNDSDVSFRWDTPWLTVDRADVKKAFKYFQFKGTGSGTFKLDVFYDYDTTAYKSIYLQSDPSLWDESTSEWDSTYWDFPDINKVLIPLIGRGKVVKFSFTATHRAGLSISYYGVKYVKSGFRGND